MMMDAHIQYRFYSINNLLIAYKCYNWIHPTINLPINIFLVKLISDIPIILELDNLYVLNFYWKHKYVQLAQDIGAKDIKCIEILNKKKKTTRKSNGKFVFGIWSKLEKEWRKIILFFLLESYLIPLLVHVIARTFLLFLSRTMVLRQKRKV